MQFVKPMLFEEAIEKIGAQTPIGSKLNTEQWREVPLALRENAFFSATIEDARFLQSGKNLLGDFLSGAREKLPNGQTALKAGSRAEFVKQMQEFATARGLGPLDPKDAGGLKDITSQTRLSLIFNTKTTQAKEFGYWKQGQDPDVLDEFPAQRFIREADVTTARAIHQQNEGVVRLKSDLDFWMAMNSPSIGGFGVPWGPWGFNSGMGVEDVDRAEAEALGLISPGEKAQPMERDFNDKLQASAQGLDEDMRAKLREAFGDQVEIDGDAVKWKGTAAPRGTMPAPEPSSIEPVPSTIAQRSSPVSQALQIQIADPKHAARVTKAIALIDRVHDDGVLPKINVDPRTSGDALGTYFSGGRRIAVKPTGPWPELTSIHEVGHLLDHLAIDTPGIFASEKSGLLKAWRTAVKGTEAAQKIFELRRTTRSKFYRYLGTWRELFARSYAQYIAEKTGDTTLLQQLNTIRNGPVTPWRQWQTEDFAPVREAFDKLFEEQGWL